MYTNSKFHSIPSTFSRSIKVAEISNQMVGPKYEDLNTSCLENVCVALS